MGQTATPSLRFGFEDYRLRWAPFFGHVYFLFSEWDYIRKAVIRLPDYLYVGAVCKFKFLLPGTYELDMFFTIIALGYHLSFQEL